MGNRPPRVATVAFDEGIIVFLFNSQPLRGRGRNSDNAATSGVAKNDDRSSSVATRGPKRRA
jgi:hypothetical protein